MSAEVCSIHAEDYRECRCVPPSEKLVVRAGVWTSVPDSDVEVLLPVSDEDEASAVQREVTLRWRSNRRARFRKAAATYGSPSDPPTFVARFDGTCSACGGDIAADVHPIRADGSGGYEHAEMPDCI